MRFVDMSLHCGWFTFGIAEPAEVPNSEADLYGWGLNQESAQELMHELFDVVEEFPDIVAQLCHDLKRQGYFKGFPLPAEQSDAAFGMESVSEKEINETALAFVKRGTATDSTAASSLDTGQVILEKSSFSNRRSSKDRVVATARGNDTGYKELTTLTVHNLPVDYSHEKARGLVDSLGLRDRYDVVIWFPRKQSGAHHLSHALVNFKTPNDCIAFRKRLRQRGINPTGETRLIGSGPTPPPYRLWTPAPKATSSLPVAGWERKRSCFRPEAN